MAQSLSLAAHKISCQRGGKCLFEDLSFSLKRGEALLVTGPNGAGKTSLLRLIAGLLPLQAGRFNLSGAGDDEVLPELCHYVGHANAIKNAFSVSENLAFWANFLDGPSKLNGALDAFGLGPLAELPAGLLSAGQKRKVALSRLFTAPRPIWLLDEPSVSLDAQSVKALDGAIARHLKQGGIAVVASHAALASPFKHRLALLGQERTP